MSIDGTNKILPFNEKIFIKENDKAISNEIVET